VIVGAAIVPTAPLLVPGASASLPPGVAQVCDAVDAALDRLPDHDVAVLVAGAAKGALYDAAAASLAGVGLPDIQLTAEIHGGVVEQLSGLVQYPVHRGEPLPIDLAVLTMLVGTSTPLVPVDVPATAAFDALVAIGVGIASAVSDPDLRTVVVSAGDLSAGLEERSPLHLVDGARAFDDQVLDVVDSGRLDALSRLGPDEARRVGARAWAPMAVLHGAVARGKVGLVRRHYSAPRGVGYLVAHGA
jgi:aromatic ring-opening dioxygenase LigB subunit